MPRLSSVGTQQANSCSTRATTLPSIVSVASKNISKVSLQGSAPLNCGGPAALRVAGGLDRSHFADFEIDSSFGLNWNVDPVDRGARLAAARDGLRLVQLQGGAGEVRRLGRHPTAPPPAPCRAIDLVAIGYLRQAGRKPW